MRIMIYCFVVTIEQTIEVPANHWITIEVPSQIPAGKVILPKFKRTLPATKNAAKTWINL